MNGKILFALLWCLLLLSLMSCLKKWPPFWRDAGQGKKVLWWKLTKQKVDHIEERIEESDLFIYQVGEIIWQLRASAERLEDILEKIKDEE